MLEMFETEFMQRAWLAGLIVADQAGGLFRDDFSNFLLQWDRASSCFYEYEPYGRF